MGRRRDTQTKGSDLQTFILGLLLFLLVPVILLHCSSSARTQWRLSSVPTLITIRSNICIR